MKYKSIIIASIIAIMLPMAAYVYGATAKAKDPNLTEVGKLAGASCDVKKAYAFLMSKTDARYKHSVERWDPEFACRLERLFKAAGCGYVFSGLRTRADTIRACGTDKGRPGCNAYGTSCHNYGLAVDVGGCVAKLRQMAPRYKLHFPYSKPHVQCIEHTSLKCSPQTKTCSGGVARRTIADVTGISNYNQPQGQQPQIQQSSQQPNPQNTQQQAQKPQIQQSPQSGGSGGANTDNGTNPYSRAYNQDPYDIWRDPNTGEIVENVANITCNPGIIGGTERSLIEWSCGGESTRSRGGTTRLQARFNTKGSLTGRGYARPSASTSYKIQCLAGDRVIGEDVCRVNRDSALSSNDTNTRPLLHLSAEHPSVGWGQSTRLQWATLGASNCRLNGGIIKDNRLSGSADTGKLYRTTTYLLECDTSTGSKSVKTEVRIR